MYAIFLPRQARDKHGENSKTDHTIFSGVSISGGHRNRFIGNDVYDVGTHLSTSGGAENKKTKGLFWRDSTLGLVKTEDLPRQARDRLGES